MNTTFLAILGIIGGCICAIADLFLDLKGPNNVKLGKLKVIDSMWTDMPHYRFTVSGILAFFAVPLYSCNLFSLAGIFAREAPVFAKVFLIISLVGAMGGFMIHTFLTLCPTIYQILCKEASFELAEKVINSIFRQIYFPFFTGYIMLVIIPSVMIICGIIGGIISAPLWCLCLNPIVFQLVGLLLRATGLKCFIDAPSCCAASLGLASYGVLALILF